MREQKILDKFGIRMCGTYELVVHIDKISEQILESYFNISLNEVKWWELGKVDYQ